MNKILINILLFSTLIMGTMAILTFDVWAGNNIIILEEESASTSTERPTGSSSSDSSDRPSGGHNVGDRPSGGHHVGSTGSDISVSRPSYIPENYKSRTYILQFSIISSITTGVYNNSYYFDWTIWYPEKYDIVPCLVRGSYKSHYTLSPIFYLYNPDTYNYIIFNVANGSSGDKFQNTYTIDDESFKIYSYVNESLKSTTFDSFDDVTNDTNDVSEIAAIPYNYLSDFDSSYSKLESCKLFYNDYYLHQDASGNTDLMGGVFGENYFYRSDKTDKNFDMKNVLEILNELRSGGDVIYSSPEMSSCTLAGNMLLMKYYYDIDKPIPSQLYTYKDIFIKIKGVQNWINVSNILEDGKCILSLKDNSSSFYISGVLNMNTLINTVSTYLNKNVNDIDIQAVIWGVQYGYKKAGVIFSSADDVRTDFEFSRYIFQNISDDDYNIDIDDLGDLGNLGNGSSSTIVDNKPSSGSSSSDRDSGGHHVGDSSSSDNSTSIINWFKDFKFDFSSITNAITGTFTLAASFASLIGSVFQNFFGESVAILAMLAIGICVVLRLVGR